MNIAASSDHAARYWHALDDGRIQCDLCPRFCKLHEGQRGLCFVRQNSQQRMVLATYGRSSGFAIDPIEKKPLNHFYPGTPVLSFGTAGCNLACKFCQNSDISKTREMDALMDRASPEEIAQRAKRLGCPSVAFTYNDPVIFHEYAIDTAQACRKLGIRSVAVTAGYICPEASEEFFAHMDAANIDLKAFSEDFYYQLTGSHLKAVLETLRYVYHHTPVWLEITTLLIPGHNDSDAEIQALTEWIANNLGPEVPLHFSAFHPAWKLQTPPRTPLSTLLKARQIALQQGLKHVYIGNAHDKAASSTYCSQCGTLLIGRDWYELSEWNLDGQARCMQCGATCVGRFDAKPGDWGARRVALPHER